MGETDARGWPILRNAQDAPPVPRRRVAYPPEARPIWPDAAGSAWECHDDPEVSR